MFLSKQLILHYVAMTWVSIANYIRYFDGLNIVKEVILFENSQVERRDVQVTPMIVQFSRDAFSIHRSDLFSASKTNLSY